VNAGRRQTTRTELTHLSGLSKATVSESVAELLDGGFLREVGKHQRGRGRSQILLEFDPTARLVLGAQLEDEGCIVVLADLCARPLRRLVVPVRGQTADDFVEAVCRGVEELHGQAGLPILGLGVGAPGLLDPAGRRIKISTTYGWRDVPIADLLEARLGMPVVVANRAKVAALGEKWYGAAKGVEHLAYVFIGDVIVAGLVINEALYVGSAGGAGELGHVTMLPDGPICSCGNRGCLQALAGGAAIVQMARAKARRGDASLLPTMTGGILERVTLHMVLDAAREGDGVAREALVEAGQYLGIAIANLVNLVNPQMVVLGGPVGRVGTAILEPIRREVRLRAAIQSAAVLQIVPSALGEDAGAIGAVALFLERQGAVPLAVARRPTAAALT